LFFINKIDGSTGPFQMRTWRILHFRHDGGAWLVAGAQAAQLFFF
jgi:hypothetical protein